MGSFILPFLITNRSE